MDDPFERPRLSRTSVVALALLGLSNLLLVGYYVTRSPGADAPVRTTEQMLGDGIRLLDEAGPVSADGAPGNAAGKRESAAAPQNVVTEEPARGTTPGDDLQPTPAMATAAAAAESDPTREDDRGQLSEEERTAAAGLVCRRWGPLADQEALERVRARVEAVGEVVEVRAAELESLPDYLVYLKSDNNIDNARRLKQELDGLGIDAYVMAGGDYATSVSSGVFSSSSRAERHRRRLVELGYEPEIAVLRRVQAAQLLIARVPADFEGGEGAGQECAAIASAR